MNRYRLGRVVGAYGVFLMICGITGFIITKEHSTSAIVNGILFGGLMVVMGFFMRDGRAWTLPAVTSAAGIFTLTFLWRAIVQITSTEPGHTAVSVLLLVMFVVSAVVSWVLISRLRR